MYITVGLVDHHDRVALQIGLIEKLPKQHSIGHVLDDGLLAGAVLEANRVAHLLTELDVHLLRDASGHTHRGDSPGLRAPYLAQLTPARLVEVLRNLSCLSKGYRR